MHCMYDTSASNGDLGLLESINNPKSLRSSRTRLSAVRIGSQERKNRWWRKYFCTSGWCMEVKAIDVLPIPPAPTMATWADPLTIRSTIWSTSTERPKKMDGAGGRIGLNYKVQHLNILIWWLNLEKGTHLALSLTMRGACHIVRSTMICKKEHIHGA